MKKLISRLGRWIINSWLVQLIAEESNYFKRRIRNWLMEKYLDWAFQLAPPDEHNGRIVREMIAAYEDTFKR